MDKGNTSLKGLTWFKATSSNGSGGCVEAARLPDGGMAVRDSKHSDSPVLQYTRHEWECFLAGAKSGEFDL